MIDNEKAKQTENERLNKKIKDIITGRYTSPAQTRKNFFSTHLDSVGGEPAAKSTDISVISSAQQKFNATGVLPGAEKILTMTNKFAQDQAKGQENIEKKNAYYAEKYKDTPKTYEGYMKHAQYVSSDERKWLEKQAEQYATAEDYKKEADRAKADYNYYKNLDVKNIEKTIDALAIQKQAGFLDSRAKIEKRMNEAQDSERIAESKMKEKVYAEKYKDTPKTYEGYMKHALYVSKDEREWLEKQAEQYATAEDYKKEADKASADYNYLNSIKADVQGNGGVASNKLEDLISEANTNYNKYKSSARKKEYEEKAERLKEILDNDVNTKTAVELYYDYQKEKEKGEWKVSDFKYTPEQARNIIRNFKALADKGYDPDALYTYYDRVKREEASAENLQKIQQDAMNNPVGASLWSVGDNVVGSIGDAVNYIGAGIAEDVTGEYQWIDTNDTAAARVNTVRGTVSDMIEGGMDNETAGKIASFLYQTGMSMADFAATAPLNLVPGVGTGLQMVLLSTEAGTAQAKETYDNTGNAANALKTGILAGIAEAFFEKFSIENLKTFKSVAPDNVKSILKNAGKQMFTEASEEGLTTIANTLTDSIINGDMSAIALEYQGYIDEGYSEEEATLKCAESFAKQVALDAAGGAVSGGVLGGGVSAVSYAQGKINSNIAIKKSAQELGQEVMSGEEFDINVLLEQAKNSSNEKAENIAKSIEKKMSKNENYKVDSVDVGNLVKLLETENISGAVSENTDENEGENNGTEKKAAANTESNETISKEKIEEHSKYKFGSNHKNGLNATDRKGNKVVIVGVESSSRAYGEADNKVRVIADDGRVYNTDSLTFNLPEYNILMNAAKNFDTNGAGTLVQEYGDYVNFKGEEGNVSNYISAYSELYEAGKMGGSYKRVANHKYYAKYIDELGPQRAIQAVKAGNMDSDMFFSNEDKLVRIDRSGDVRANVMVEESAEGVVNLDEGTRLALEKLSEMTGKDIILTADMDENGRIDRRDGKIYIRATLNGNYIMPVAMHESMHSIRKESPKDYALIRNFVVDYLFAKGNDVNKMIDRVESLYKDKVSTREDCLEEIVCNSIMAIAGDESAMKKALQVAKAEKSILDKLANAIKNLAGKIKNFILTHTTNEAAKTFVKDVEALDKLAEMFSNAADNIKAKSEEVITNEQKNSDEKFSIGGLKAETADKTMLKKAMELENEGTDSEKIRKETGWFKGYDGKWRFEIDDAELKFKTDVAKNRATAIELAKMKAKSAEIEWKIVNDTATEAEENEYYSLDEKMVQLRKWQKLSDVINHPKLFKAYPQLKDVNVYYEISSLNRGLYSSKGNVIRLNPMCPIGEQKEIIIHEIQHAIQRIEDFANGSSLEYWENLGYTNEEAMVLYYYTAGEIEARDVSNRVEYDNEQRKNNRPDIDRDDVVFANSGESGYSSDENIMQDDFENKVDQIENNTYNSNDVVIMGRTPKVLQDIGFNSLPVAMTKNHIYSVAVSEARAKNEGRYKQNTNYHDLGFNTVKQIYNKISDPLMVIAHPDFTNKESRDSTHKVIALVDLSVNNKQVIAPIVVDFESRYNKKIIDVNLVATYFNKNNIHDLIKEAIALENNNQVGFYYLDKKRTQSIIKQKGYQLPSVLNNLSSNIIIRKIDSNVNKKINKITQSQQFVRWFGDWQNKPKTASKVVDGNGEPLVVYHQTGNDFTVFDTKHTGAGEFDSEMPTGIFMKPTSDNIGLSGNKQMALYANIRNPLTVNNRAELVRFYEKNIDGYKEAREDINNIDSEYEQKYENAEASEDEEYSKLWNDRKQGTITEEEYQKAIESNKLDELEEEWRNKVNEASKEAKSLIDDYFRNSNYDGVIVNNDVGSFGRSTKTYIAFKNTQVKSATDNIGTFDGKNPDIRYSIDDTKSSAEKYSEDDFKNDVTIHLKELSQKDKLYHNILERLANNEAVSIGEIANLEIIKYGKLQRGDFNPTIKDNSNERKKLREKIQSEVENLGSAIEINGKWIYNGVVKKNKRADIVIGLPAAGKSSVLVDPLSAFFKSRIVDSDVVKEKIPEFNNGFGAGNVHEESKLINECILNNAINKGENIVLPVVGSNYDNVLSKINNFKNSGYKVYLHLNELPMYKALGRMINRFVETGRYLSPSLIYKYKNKPTEVFEKIINQKGDMTDEYSEREGSAWAALNRGNYGYYKMDVGRISDISQRRGLDRGRDSKIRRRNIQKFGIVDGYSRYSNDVSKGTPPIFKSGTFNIHELYEQSKNHTNNKSDFSDIRYAIDDTLNDWLDDLPEGIDYEKVVEKNPVVAVAKIYNSASKTAESGLRQSQNVRLEEKDYLRIAGKIMDKYGIKGKYNPNYKQELAGQLTGFVKRIGEKGTNFTDVFEELVNDCKGGILLSGKYDTELMKDEREFVLDLIHDKTLFIRPRDIQQIEEDYGSVAKYRKKMFGKTNVAIKTKESGRGYYIEDVIALVEEYYPYLLDENADGDMGYLWLENLVNNVLKPKYKNPYFDGENSFYETPETAAVQMAFDCTTEIINQKTSRFKADKRADKKLIRKLETSQNEAVKLATELAVTKNKQYRQELKEAKERNTELWKTNSELRQQKNEEHRKRVEHARQMFRKNLKEKQKTREQRNKNAELRKQNEAYRAIVASNYRTIREEYNEGRNKTLYIQKLGRMCDRLTKRLNGKARNNEYIPDNLKVPIVDLLRCFTVKNEKGATPAVFGDWNRIKEVGDRVADLEREYAKLKSSKSPKLENQPASFFDITSIQYKADVMDRLSELSLNLRGHNIYTLTSYELYAIYDTMQELEESLKDAVQIIVDGKKLNFMSLANTAIEEVKNNKSITDYSKMRNVVAAPFKQLGKSYITTHLDPMRYGRMLSNYNDDSIIYKMFSDLHKGENHAIALQHEAISRIKEVTIKYSDEVKKIQNEDVKEFNFKDVETGRRVPITQGVLLAIYLTDRQKSGHIHLLGGTDESYGNKTEHFTVLPNFELDNMKLKRTAKEHPNKVRFTVSDLKNIEKYVENNKVLMELASAISEVYNQTLKQEINEVSMAKYGMKIATVKNYYPLQVYSDAGKYEKVLETESYDTRLKSRGFTKKRVWSSTPIVIEDALRKYVKQVREVSEYCGMVIPIENFKKVYNYSDGTQTLHSTIKDRYGVTAEHYIDKLIGDLQQRADTIDNTFLDTIQSNYMGMKIMFNMGSMIKQLSAFPLANRYFGAKNVSLAALNLFRNKVDFDLYNKYTSYLWYRKEGNGTVVGELSREMSLVKKWQDTFDFVGKMDNRVVASLLYAAELHVEQTTDLKKGTDAFYREVARQFEKCIDETQPNNMVTSKPQYLRNKNLRRLSLNAFRSQNMAIGNTIFDSFFEMKARMADDKINSTAESKAAKKAAVLKFVSCCVGAISSHLLNGFLSTLAFLLLYHHWDDVCDDEGNISGQKIALNYLDEVLNGIFGSFAIGDYLYSAVSSAIDIGKTYYGLQVMSVDSINDMVNDVISGKALDALKTLLDCLGIPGTNIARFGSSIYAYYNDVAKGSGRIITDSKGNVVTDYLHYYIVEDKKDGNSSRAEYYESMWKEILMDKGKTESEATDYIKSKIVTALSADDDIEEAGVAKANGNLADYEKYRQKVIDCGFDSKDVQKAIDRFIKSEAKLVSEIEGEDERKQELMDNGFNENGAEYVLGKIETSQEYDDESKSTSAFDETSGEDELVMYSYSDLFDALINGDTENYDMIEKGGKTKQEIESAMRSASRTDKLWAEYIEASTSNDRERTKELVEQLTRIYGSWSKAKSALTKYRQKNNK